MKTFNLLISWMLFNFKIKQIVELNLIDKKALSALGQNFGFSNYQMLVIYWIKGLWTGILLSLVLHHFITH